MTSPVSLPLPQPRLLAGALTAVLLAVLAAATPAAAEPFSRGETVPSHTYPRQIVTDDFDGDGDLDLAATNSIRCCSADVAVHTGGGDGTFAAPGGRWTGAAAHGLATGDVDGDGVPDLAVAHLAEPTLTVLRGGSGSLFPDERRTFHGLHRSSRSAEIADLDDDGYDDVIVTTRDDSVAVLRGAENGAFGAVATVAAGTRISGDLATADVDQDGDLDVAVTDEYPGDGKVSLLLNDGAGNLSPAGTFATGDESYGIVAADFDDDGDPDLAVANPGSDDVSVLVGEDGAGFAAASTLPAGARAIQLVAGDLNGDGDEELVVANQNGASLTVFAGGADATFPRSATLVVRSGGGSPVGPEAPVLGDFDEDGDLDIAVTHSFGEIALFLGGAPDAPTSLALAGPSTADDDAVEVTGTVESDTTVELFTTADCSGTPAATGTADAFGGAGITVPVPADTATTIRARASDLGGTSACSTDSVTFTEDSTDPAAPTIAVTPAGPADDTSPVLSGTAAEGSVDLYASDDCSGTPVGSSARSGDDGEWSVTATVADDSVTTFTAGVTDAAGNRGCSEPVTYTEDSTAPSAPALTGVDPAGPANDDTPRVSGTAEAGATVRVFTTDDCRDEPAATGTAASSGAFDVEVEVGDDTTTTFHATAQDVAGNTSGCSDSSVTYTEDSTAAAAPTGLAVDPAGPADDTSIAVRGDGGDEAGSVVKLYATADCTGTAVAEGTLAAFAAGFAYTVADDSTTRFSATVTDPAGNPSECSAPVTYVEDSTGPAAPTLESFPGSPSNENIPQLRVTTEPGASVAFFGSGDCTGDPEGTGTASSEDGTWWTMREVPEDAVTTFSARATDGAGNPSNCAVLRYTEDSTAPEPPAGLAYSPASPSSDDTPTLTGTAEAGAEVRLYDDDECFNGADVIATTTAGSDGAFSVEARVAENARTRLSVDARDAAGNQSGCRATPTYRHDSIARAPTRLAITPAGPADDDTPVVSGSADDASGSVVKLYADTDCTGDPLAQASGEAFAEGVEVTVGEDRSTVIRAALTDAAGNTSSCSEGVTYVEDSTAPAAPDRLATDPAGPADDTTPRVRGRAEAGTTVRVHTDADCTGAPVATGTAAQFGDAGIEVTVEDGSTTAFRVTATDEAGNRSACSDAVTYVERAAPVTPEPERQPEQRPSRPGGGPAQGTTPGPGGPGARTVTPTVAQTAAEALVRIAPRRNGTAVATFWFTQPGSLAFTGAEMAPRGGARGAGTPALRLRRVRTTVAPGRVRVTLRPSAALRRVLARRRSVRVRVRVTFTPAGGRPSSVTRVVRLRLVR